MRDPTAATLISRANLARASIVACLSRSRRTGNRDGNILEYSARCRQQEVGSYDDTFVPTSKFSCIQWICVIAVVTLISAIAVSPLYIQARSKDLKDRRWVSASRYLHQGTASSCFPASLSHYHARVSLNYIWRERRARLLCDSWHMIVIYLCCVIHVVW